HRIDLIDRDVAALLGAADQLLDGRVGQIEQRERGIRAFRRPLLVGGLRLDLFLFLRRHLDLARHQFLLTSPARLRGTPQNSSPLPYGDSPRIHRTDTRRPTSTPRAPPATGRPIAQKGSAYLGTARIARPVSWSRPKLRLTLFLQRQQGVIPVPPSSVVPVPARKGSKTLRRPAR